MDAKKGGGKTEKNNDTEKNYYTWGGPTRDSHAWALKKGGKDEKK
jgi:hypothetical protein